MKNKKRYIIISAINMLSVLFMICGLYYIYIWYKDNKSTENILNEILNDANISYEEKKINDNDEANINVVNVDWNKLNSINQDTIGWIKVQGTEINYPVVQTSDNDFYLTHSFDKSYNKAGWIFADCNNKNLKNNQLDKNTIVYGHNRQNDSMFGTLSNVLKKEWQNSNSNRYIEFSTPVNNMIWEVFSIYTKESEDYYINNDFTSDEEYSKFLNTIKNRSIYNFETELSTNDNILTLSTCTNIGEGRIVVHAKLIKTG